MQRVIYVTHSRRHKIKQYTFFHVGLFTYWVWSPWFRLACDPAQKHKNDLSPLLASAPGNLCSGWIAGPQHSLCTLCTRFSVLIRSTFYLRESCWTQKRTRVTTTKWWPNVLVLMFNWLRRKMVLRSSQKIVSSNIIQGFDWIYEHCFILLVFETHFDLFHILQVKTARTPLTPMQEWA